VALLALEREIAGLPELVRCLNRGAPAVSQAVARLRGRARVENALAERLKALRFELDRIGIRDRPGRPSRSGGMVGRRQADGAR